MNIEKMVNNYKDQIVKSVRELVSIKSVEEEPKEGAPFGEGPRKALNYCIEAGNKMGFKVTDYDGYAIDIDFNDGEEVVGVLGHVDVVPEGTGWTYPPYEAQIHDGKIFGRGTMDDKGPTIAVLYAMKILKDLDVKLSRKIRLIIGANEETGWGCMKHYFKVNKAPDMAFTPDANFPVIHGEKGIIVFDLLWENEQSEEYKILSLNGGNAANMVPELASVKIEFKDISGIEDKLNKIKDIDFEYEIKDNILDITAKGISAHGSTPEVGKNAISYLMAILENILDDDNCLGGYSRLYNDRIGFYHNGEKIGCNLSDDVSGKLNFNPGVISLKDNEIKLVVNVRYPIKSSSEEVYLGIEENLKDTNLRLVRGEKDQKPLYVPEDNFLVEKLMDVYREVTGDIDSKPITIGGGTYARAMENAVAFGPVFPGQVELAHQKDEFIEIDQLMKLVEIYTKALYNLAK